MEEKLSGRSRNSQISTVALLDVKLNETKREGVTPKHHSWLDVAAHKRLSVRRQQYNVIVTSFTKRGLVCSVRDNSKRSLFRRHRAEYPVSANLTIRQSLFSFGLGHPGLKALNVPF